MELSIIIPVYNVKEYIKECLDSIYQSDVELNKVEVLCIDDKGNDNSIEIVKEYIEEHHIGNLKIITHSQNKGLSEARNTGMKQALGKYICFLDSDDMLVMSNLNSMLEQAIKFDLDILEGNFKEVIETETNICLDEKKSKKTEMETQTGDQYFYNVSKNDTYFPMACIRIYKTEYLLKNKIFFKPGIKFEDEEFSPRAIIGAKRVQHSDTEFYIYRRRNNSITTNMVKDNKWIDSYLSIINCLTEFSQTISQKQCQELLEKRIANFALSILKNPIAYGASSENVEEAIKIVKEQKIYRIPQKNKDIKIKIQGYLMKHPKLFIKFYKRQKGQ